MHRNKRAVPQARAIMAGGPGHAALRGTVDFRQTERGVLVTANVSGLPQNQSSMGSGIFGFHIHEGHECAGNAQDPFELAGEHYNPTNTEHPYHAGDMPPLFENGGRAYLSFLTERFVLGDVVGRTVIIHDMPDDFHTQPSGDSDGKIACGVITRM